MCLSLPTLAEPLSFSLDERIVFIALAAASVYGFWRRFGPILNKILHSRKDPGFSLAPLGCRVRDFVWEVMLQARVISQRPLAGLAHALVFWAFCAFALVTLNHCALILGIGFLAPESWAGRFYSWFAALFALACAVGILGLFVRRFLVQPRWLGKVSPESGVIAMLIFALMVTYLAEFYVPAGGLPARALWWAHTLVLLGFLPLIPHTKHLHLVLSPFTVFLSRGSFSQIPPLAGDEDFGLVTGKDLTQIVSLQAYSCVECGRCTEHCPANNTGKELNPKEIVLGLRAYLNDLGPQSEEPLLGKYNSQRAAFECTTCGACEFQCPVGIEHLPIIVGLRRGAVNTGEWDDAHGAKLFLALERGSNALGLPATERDKFIEKNALPIYDGTQEYLLWLGCMGAYDPRGREIVVSLVEVMRHLGVTFGVLRKEKCTGDPVRRLGNDLLFQQLAESNLEALSQSKARKILSICPHCVRTIQEDWKEFGTPPAVEHHSEFLARHLPELSNTAAGQQNASRRAPTDHAGTGTEAGLVSGHGFSHAETGTHKEGALAPARVPPVPPLEPGRNERIVFHDPCYLGRYRNVYDEPRAVAASAGQLVEAPRHRERSFCCGAGGGLAFLGEESGERVSHVRAAELAATGATTIAAACPFCNTMFRDALAAQGPDAPQLVDIAQLAARNLPRASN